MTEQSKAALVRKLMSRRKYRELHELLLGRPPSNLHQPPEELPPLALVKLLSAVRRHLRFLAQFGEGKQHVREGKVHHFAYPERFEQWLEQGAPEVTLEELQRLDEES